MAGIGIIGSQGRMGQAIQAAAVEAGLAIAGGIDAGNHAVDGDQGFVVSVGLVEVVVDCGCAWHDDEAVDLLFEQGLDCLAFDFEVFVGVRDQYFVAVGSGGVDDAFGGAVEEDVGEVGDDDEADGFGVAGSHRSGDLVGGVADLAGGRFDDVSGLFRDASVVA